MPIIEVKMLSGRSNEQKAELARELTAAAVRVLDVEPQRVRVVIVEIPAQNWAVAGKTLA